MPHEHDDEEQVRRLLAEARHDEPMPAEVAARLEETLAALAATPPLAGVDDPAADGTVQPDRDGPDRAGQDRDAPDRRVPDLTARRRRTARNLLVAAAAVVVLGVGLAQLDVSPGGEDAATSADSVTGEADGAGAGDGDGAEAAESPVPADSGEETYSAGQDSAPVPQTEALSGRAAAFATVVRLHPDHFAQQIRRLAADHATERQNNAQRDSSAAAEVRCDDEAWGEGTRQAVRYAGSPGVLVFRPAQGRTQVVDLYLCGAADPARSITLAEE